MSLLCMYRLLKETGAPAFQISIPVKTPHSITFKRWQNQCTKAGFGVNGSRQ